MTFTELVDDVMTRLNLTSTEAEARIGTAVNRKYKEVTSAIGLVTARRTEVQATATLGVQTLTFDGVEKVISVIDRSASSPRVLNEVTYDELLSKTARTDDAPRDYAIKRNGAGTVTVLLDVSPQTAFTLYAEGHETASTLSGAQEPSFPESFHDVLVEGVLMDELRKKEKVELARMSQQVFEKRLSDLRMWMAKSAHLDIFQGKQTRTTASMAGGAATSTTNGSLSYTQTGLVTFDRSSAAPSDAPFAVAPGANLVANLDADLLDGEQGSAYHALGNATGTLAVARLGNGVTTVVTSSATSSQNNWAPGLSGNTLIVWSGAADVTITGFAGGVSGQVVTFRNSGSNVAYFAHQSGSSSSGNKLRNAVTSSTTPVAAGGYATYAYDGTDWLLVAHEQGAWVQRTFSAGNFTAAGSMTWTVGSGDVTADRYRLSGRTLSYEFSLATTTIGGSVSTALFIAIPNSYSPSTTVLSTSAVVRNPTTLEACYMNVVSAGSTMTLTRVAESTFTLSTNGTAAFGSFTFDVT